MLLKPLLVTFSLAAAQPTFESVKVPRGWSVAKEPLPEQTLKLRIALKQQNVAEFEQKLLEISNPKHQHYGKHMQGHEIEAFLKPTEEAAEAVSEWLKENGVSNIHRDREWINFHTNVKTANQMLNTSFLWYKNEHHNTVSLRTSQYSVPEHIIDRIDLIQPTTRFDTQKPLRSTIYKTKNILRTESTAQPNCSIIITPDCLRDLYNVHYKADPSSGSGIGYASFLGQYTRYSDMEVFEKLISPYTIGRNFSVIPLHGGSNNQSDHSHSSNEANLDGQYTMAVGHPLPVTQFIVGGKGPLVPDLDEPTPESNSNEPYLDYLTELMQLPNQRVPQVISHSYGENEQSVPESYNKKVCNLFSQLGARGVSIIFSSGDLGVGDACVSNDGLNKTEFQPSFPASCPWVTSVGSTYKNSPEQAAAFSTGGFSRVYRRPEWQARAASKFVKGLGDRFHGFYNPKGRGIPDVSAQGVNYAIYDSGRATFISGTSASAPTFASLIALLNSARLSAGKQTLGFLNPWLYDIEGEGAFNDITIGGNIGCSGADASTGLPNGSPHIPYAGFNATQGWDPVTGLGTPNFGKMLQLVAPGAKNQGGPVPIGGNATSITKQKPGKSKGPRRVDPPKKPYEWGQW